MYKKKPSCTHTHTYVYIYIYIYIDIYTYSQANAAVSQIAFLLNNYMKSYLERDPNS